MPQNGNARKRPVLFFRKVRQLSEKDFSAIIARKMVSKDRHGEISIHLQMLGPSAKYYKMNYDPKFYGRNTVVAIYDSSNVILSKTFL